MLGIVLSVGAIPALVPIIIIIILIAAAAGLTRGTDLFALFGIDALLGLASGIGRGGTGKGLVNRSYGSGRGGRKSYIGAGSKVVPKPLVGVIKGKVKKSKYVKSMITNTVTGGASAGAAGAAVPNPARAPGGKVNMAVNPSGAAVPNPAAAPGGKVNAAVNPSSAFTKPTPLGSRVKNSMKGAIVKNAPKIAFVVGGISGYLIYKQVTKQPKDPRAKQLKKQAKQYKKQVKQFKKNNPGQYKNMKEQYKDQWEKAHNPNYGARTKTQKIKAAFATITDPQKAYVTAVEKIANSAIGGTEKIQQGRVAQKYAGKNTMPPLSVGVDQPRLQEMKDEKAKIIDSRDIDKFSGRDWLSLWGASFHSDINERKRTWYENWKKAHP